ncbi:SpoVK/Ycf46/Vps4 family AAA+-type ATPase [Rhizobium sp. BK602]|nr:SpoVK/Ycf46/Vps4 family AAA+-type ATPase [Rhizobium sp. BK602]
MKDYLLEVNHATAWDDIVGNDTARAALVEAIEEPKLHPELYDYYGMRTPKGVLLYGPPGCGKTMFAKAAAAAVGRVYGAKAEVLVVNGPQIQSPYVGKTEETIRAIFKFAREYAAHHKHPLTVFFDEAEVLFPDRTGRARRVMPWEESQVAQFLAEMDGLNTMGAFVILATNRPEAIDEALLRDGRCDRKIKVERPNRAAVEHILLKALDGAPSGDSINDLVMAGVESFFNPHYVIRDAHIIAGQITADGPQVARDIAVNFCLEHIVSGAMVVGIVQRAKSLAFARDRKTGERSGLKTADMLAAVKQVFDENKTLDHAFAMREWIESMPLKEMVRHGGGYGAMSYDDLPQLALSIRQPWVHCILHLGKPVENRDWSTKIRGPICLHAAKGMTRDEWRYCLETARYAGAGFDDLRTFPGMNDLPRGGIVGTAEIVDVVTTMGSPWFFGRYGFVLRNPKPIDFIPVKGALGFFDWRKSLTAREA